MDKNAETLVEDFFSNYRLRKYAKGQVLLLNGDNADYVFYLVSGRVKQYDITYRGDEVILNVFKPTSFFPMSLAINKTPNPYTYEAETDVELRQAPSESVVAFLKAHPAVTFALLSRVYRGLDGLLGRVAYLMASSARGRLLYELVIIAKRHGDSQADEVEFAMTETDIASRAGLTRETVSREMKKLIHDNLVHLNQGTVIIPSLSKLEAKLNSINY
ncbi:MAG TPA: Crp/Fnr family transcriptional regulator [Candidatus Saccharimonadales bacterium]